MHHAASRLQKAPRVILIGVLVFIWLAVLVFYWSVEPAHVSNYHTLAGLLLSYLALWGVIFLCSHVSKRETVQRFLLTSVSFMLSVGLLEALVLISVVDFRLVFSTPISEPWRHPDNLLDPKLLHIHKPYSRWQWWGIDYRYDQHGFRNESDLEMADIIVIGDSFIEGMGVSAADLVTSHLAQQLDNRVVNLGQAWYGPQQELEVLRRYGLRLRPKVCVWVIFEGNDLSDVRRYNEATRDWDNFSKHLHSFFQRSFTKNAILALRRLLSSISHRSAENATSLKNISSGTFEEFSGRKTPVYFWYEGLHLSAKDYRALEELSSVLVQAYQLCSTHGAKFLVVFAPTKFRVYNSFTEFDTYAKPRYWVVNDLPERLEATVRDRVPGAEFLDLTPALAQEANRGALVYFSDDTHWSQKGHLVVATEIADFLMQWKAKGVSADEVFLRH